MSTQRMLPDRATVLASLRDYIEQLSEEGLDGVPAVNPPSQALSGAQTKTAGMAAVNAATKPAGIANSPDEKKLTVKRDGAAGQPQSPQGAPANTGTELFYRYPGLERIADLDALREFIGACTRCKLAPGRTKLVFGVGNPNAELMFVGEAPGADEDLQGEPFVGRAGQLLTDIVERGMGMSRNDVYICNVIKCRPPENRNPEPDEVSSCEPFLFRQIDLVRPKAIVGLGTFAVQALLKVKTPISKLRGNWHEVRGIKMMPTFHPAYLLRNPADKRLVWADIQKVMKFLGQPIPSNRSRR
jgi:uracil-DNA glycosylase family 4